VTPALSNLSDVSLDTPSNGDVLLYNNGVWENGTGAGTGDMTKAVYDPNSIEADVFDMDNMVEGATNLILTSDERNKLSGIETSQTIAGGVTAGLVYFDTSDWKQADASTEGTASKRLGIYLGLNAVQVSGDYSTMGLTAGAIYYLSETAGAITATKPTTSTSIVRIIGYAKSTTVLEFKPDVSFVENL
jgi:hypothetical protein